MVLLASVERFGGAFALGLFAGLCYARSNLLVVAPAYILSVIAFSPTPWTLLCVAVPVVLYIGIYFAFYRLRRNVNILFTTAAAVASELVHAVPEMLYGGGVTEGVLSVVLAGVFAFCAQTVCYAVLLRGIKTRFTPDELVAGGLVIVVFAYAAACAGGDGFRLVFALMPFFVMLAGFGRSWAAAFAVAALAGAGGTLAYASPCFMAYTCALAAVCAALSPLTKWASAAGSAAVYAVVWLAFGEAGWGWQDLVLTALGAGAFLFLPRGALSGLFGGKKGTAAALGIDYSPFAEMAGQVVEVTTAAE